MAFTNRVAYGNEIPNKDRACKLLFFLSVFIDYRIVFLFVVCTGSVRRASQYHTLPRTGALAILFEMGAWVVYYCSLSRKRAGYKPNFVK